MSKSTAEIRQAFLDFFHSKGHQVADQTGQTCGTIVVSQADSGTNGKQPCHVIDQSAACLDQQEANGVSCTGGCSTGNAHNARSEA